MEFTVQHSTALSEDMTLWDFEGTKKHQRASTWHQVLTAGAATVPEWRFDLPIIHMHW
jgi:hypothetical protein